MTASAPEETPGRSNLSPTRHQTDGHPVPTASGVPSTELAGSAAGPSLPTVFGFFVAVGFLLLFWPTVRCLVELWTDDPDQSHGLLVPVVCLAVLVGHRDRIREAWRRSRASPVWLSAFAAGFTFLLLGLYSGVRSFDRFGMWLALAGSVGFLGGLTFLRAVRFPLFFLLLSFPVPGPLFSALRLELKSLATRLAAEVLLLSGYSALPEGNVLVVGPHHLEVADACSGIRSLMALVTTAVLLGYLVRARWWQGALLVGLAVPVTVASNLARILIVAISLASFEIDLTSGWRHEVMGYLSFGFGFLLLWGAWELGHWALGSREAAEEGGR